MTDQEELYSQQMEERWQQLQRAQDRGAPATELERIYGSYLDALDDYNAAVRKADATRFAGFTAEDLVEIQPPEEMEH